MSAEDRTWQLAGGFEGICSHVRDIAPMAEALEALEAVGGYARLDLRDDDPANFPGAPAASPRVRQDLLHAAGDLRGRVGLIAFDGEGWTAGRYGAPSGDPGGVVDIGLYTRDIETLLLRRTGVRDARRYRRQRCGRAGAGDPWSAAAMGRRRAPSDRHRPPPARQRWLGGDFCLPGNCAKGAVPSALDTVLAAPFGAMPRFFVTTPGGANLEFFQPGEGWCDKGWIS